MTANAQFAGLDRFKIVAALLVIAILTGPLISYSPYADFVLAGIAARVAVPFSLSLRGFVVPQADGEKARDRGLLLVRQTGGSGTALSGMMSFGVAFFLRRLQQSAPDPRRRAWAEIRLDDVTHNVRELRGLLPPDCELMAVVKADAYGHGSIPVARHLSRIGVRHFAVADVEEGIALRREGIKEKYWCSAILLPGGSVIWRVTGCRRRSSAPITAKH